jgi:ketosteroid isomerase-like protein
MKLVLVASGLAVVFIAALGGQSSDLKSELAALVQSELRFSKAAEGGGMRDAFLQFLADRSIVFRPNPVDGRKWYSENPPADGVLSWYPVFADIAGTGDLGYTTGPYEYRAGNSGAAVQHGRYMSVWRKQPDGTWKVAVDCGVSGPAPPAREPPWKPPGSEEPRPARPAADLMAERDRLRAVEGDLSAAAGSRGTARAYADCLDENSRFLRADGLVLLGKDAIVQALASRKEAWSWRSDQCEVSRAADLGYTCGTIAIRTRAAAIASIQYQYYTRVWRRAPNGDWKLALDIASPGPRPSNQD